MILFALFALSHAVVAFVVRPSSFRTSVFLHVETVLFLNKFSADAIEDPT
jgi:hypothetical protein